MAEHILFLTGRLAEKSLHRVLATLAPERFTYEVRVLGIAVAALMTADFIGRHLDGTAAASRVLVPGRCRGDLAALAARYGVPFERGPEELKDLDRHFGVAGRPRDLSQSDVRIFAEIVDAPELGIEQILERATRYRRDGADVIDIGCLPQTPFPALETVVRELKSAGFAVSVDSVDDHELLRGGRAGADYLFSLHAGNLWIAEEVAAVPVLVGSEPADLESLARTVEARLQTGRPFYADPILDPVHYGFTAAIGRYAALRTRFPDIDLMMGIGNLTELTHADSLGVNALLLGVVSELGIRGVLTTEVSGHCRTAIREIDRARRILYAAHADHVPPRHIDEGLLALHERNPFPYSPQEIAEFAAAIRDDSYRIQVSPAGIHVYNRRGLHTALDPYALYPQLDLEGDAGHAFYLGLELARAEIAWQLGKRYSQDEPLAWGCVVDRPPAALEDFAPVKSTLAARKAARRRHGPPSEG